MCIQDFNEVELSPSRHVLKTKSRWFSKSEVIFKAFNNSANQMTRISARRMSLSSEQADVCAV